MHTLHVFRSDPRPHQEGLSQVQQQTCPLSSQEVSVLFGSREESPGILQCLRLSFLQGAAFEILGWTFAEGHEWSLSLRPPPVFELQVSEGHQ